MGSSLKTVLSYYIVYRKNTYRANRLRPWVKLDPFSYKMTELARGVFIE